MKVYVFNSTAQQKLHGYTPDWKGAKLPPQLGPWRAFKQIEINSGDSVKADELLMAINDSGFYLGPAELNFD